MSFAKHKNRPSVHQRASELRKSGSIIERTLRRAIKEEYTKPFGVRFRYQHPVDPYIVDFVCLTARLIVEIDGMSHDSSHAYDMKRQLYLEQQGFHVLRFSNADVVKNARAVAIAMYEKAKELQKARWADPTPRLQSKRDPPARGG